jgi:predicted RNase H-like HicB family nuclease
MVKRRFTLEYWQDDGWYVGRLREVPGVFSQGETLDELEDNIRDAYELVLEDEQPPAQRPDASTKDIVVDVA